MLKLVLINLLANALKFTPPRNPAEIEIGTTGEENGRLAMPEGGKLIIETAKVELAREHAARHIDLHSGSYAMLTISDNGLGMDDGTCKKIFAPFFTTKDAGKGTGLGLSTVYGIVKQSGGAITVASRPGHGRTFSIYLPCVEEVPNLK